MSSPLGPLFAAVNRRGLCAVDFGRRESDFLNGLDPRARLEKNPKADQHVMAQLRQYYAGGPSTFNLTVDTSQLTPFQRRVLEVTSHILAGQVCTYHHVPE